MEVLADVCQIRSMRLKEKSPPSHENTDYSSLFEKEITCFKYLKLERDIPQRLPKICGNTIHEIIVISPTELSRCFIETNPDIVDLPLYLKKENCFIYKFNPFLQKNYLTFTGYESIVCSFQEDETWAHIFISKKCFINYSEKDKCHVIMT